MTEQGGKEVNTAAKNVAAEINNPNVQFDTVPMDEDVSIDIGNAVDAPDTPQLYNKFLDTKLDADVQAVESKLNSKADFDKVDAEVLGASDSKKHSKAKSTKLAEARSANTQAQQDQEGEIKAAAKSKPKKTMRWPNKRLTDQVISEIQAEQSAEKSAIEGKLKDAAKQVDSGFNRRDQTNSERMRKRQAAEEEATKMTVGGDG